MLVYVYSQTFWHPGVECKYWRFILLAEQSCTWQCSFFIRVIVIFSFSCLCAAVIFFCRGIMPLYNNFTVSILCDNLINMQQVTPCCVTWKSCPMDQCNVCEKLFPCIFNMVCAVHDAKFNLSNQPYIHWSVSTKRYTVTYFDIVCTVHHNQFYKQTNKMHFLYVFILQSFCNSVCFEWLFCSSSGVHKFTVSVALYKPCKRV